MSTLKYPGVVRAARNVGQEKKNLAEQLYLEIPPRGRGRRPAGEVADPEKLTEAAAEILAETGETYTWESLRDYRDVAAWVARNSRVHTSIPWADASWTAHVEAYKKGISWADFAAGKRTKRAVREQAGASTGDVPAAARAINAQPAEAAKLVEGLSDKAKADLSARLVKDNPAARKAAADALVANEEGIRTLRKAGGEAAKERIDAEDPGFRERHKKALRDADLESEDARKAYEEILRREHLAVIQLWLHDWARAGDRQAIELVKIMLDEVLGITAAEAEALTPEMFTEGDESR